MSTKKADIYDKILLTTAAWLLMLLILHCAGLRVMLVCGQSMQPTLGNGTLIISLTAKHFPSFEHGDVITFHPAPDSEVAYVKRIIGLPGDTIEAQNDLLFINGKSDGYSQLGTGTWGPITVPPNAVFVLGDNRTVSVDSRILGCIPLQQICTKVIGKGVLLT